MRTDMLHRAAAAVALGALLAGGAAVASEGPAISLESHGDLGDVPSLQRGATYYAN